MSGKRHILTNKLGTVHLFYCAVFSTIITVAGFLSSKSPEQFLLQALFLPVTLYFDIALIGRLTSRKSAPPQEDSIFHRKSYKRYIFMFVLIIVLTALALSNILKNSTP